MQQYQTLTSTPLPSHFNMYMALPQHTVWWLRLNPISFFGHDVQDQGSTYLFSTNSYYNWPVHQHVGLISTEWQTLILTCTVCVLWSGVCQSTNNFKAALLTKASLLNVLVFTSLKFDACILGMTEWYGMASAAWNNSWSVLNDRQTNEFTKSMLISFNKLPSAAGCGIAMNACT